jgi:hypothetical protein
MDYYGLLWIITTYYGLLWNYYGIIMELLWIIMSSPKRHSQREPYLSYQCVLSG